MPFNIAAICISSTLLSGDCRASDYEQTDASRAGKPEAPTAERLNAALKERVGKFPESAISVIADLSGGLSWYRTGKAALPFSPDPALKEKVKSAASEAGLICYPVGATLNGIQGEHTLRAGMPGRARAGDMPFKTILESLRPGVSVSAWPVPA